MGGIVRKEFVWHQDAALNFQKEVRRLLEKLGFRAGRYNASTYYHPKRQS